MGGSRSIGPNARSHHLAAFFGGLPGARHHARPGECLHRIPAGRQPPAKPATIQNELAALKRMFTLGHRAGKVPARPPFPSIEVRNTRSGFFEEAQLRPSSNGCRTRSGRSSSSPTSPAGGSARSSSLTWRQVDFKAGRGAARTGDDEERRRLALSVQAFPELEELLARQRQLTSALERETGQIVPWVFHRRGKPIRSFHAAWRRACREAGCPGRFVHDLRRTAVREMERAGVPALGGDEALGSQDREHLPPLRDRLARPISPKA